MKGKTRNVKDLKAKKLSMKQQTAVKGGITDGSSNTIILGESTLRVPVKRKNGQNIP